MKRRLKYRKNVLKQPWFNERIQAACETSQRRLQKNNAHVRTHLSVRYCYELKIALTEAGCSDDASSNRMSLNSEIAVLNLLRQNQRF